MEELLKDKLKAAIEFKELTLKINELDIKTDYIKFNSLIEERQEIIHNINTINVKASDEKSKTNYFETDGIRKLNKKISRIFIETYHIDNLIRKNINCELKIIKEKLNHPRTSTESVNIKI